MTNLFQITLGISLGYCAIAAGALFLSDYLIFPTSEASYEDDSDTFHIQLPEYGLSIACSYFPANKAKATILYSHGNGEDLGQIQGTLKFLNQLGFNVLAYDYPGYGLSKGDPSEAHTYVAAQAAYDYLTAELRTPAECIFLYGRSLGGGPSVELARRNLAGGMILEGAFVSAFRVKTRWQILPWDKFENLKKLEELHCPILVIHGTHDHTVPFWHGKALYDGATQEKMKLWVEGAGHNNIIEAAGPSYTEALLVFTTKTYGKKRTCCSATRL